MMEQVKAIFKYFVALVSSPQARWQYLTDRELPEAQPDHVSRYYYWPLMGFCAVCIFFLQGLHATADPFSLELALRSATAFVVSFLAGPYVAQFVLERTLRNLYRVEVDADRLMIFIFYTLSYDMVADLLSAVMYGNRFIDLLLVYQVFIVWSASTTLFGISSSRLLFSLLTTAVLFGSHWIIACVLGLMGRW